MNNMPKSAYIHIPFCKSKCKYCSFVSFNKPECITGYMYSLMKEITDNYAGEVLNTLYFGGGTPSLVPIDLISKVIKKFKSDKNAEVTFEFNPDDVSSEYLKQLFSIGVNRLSIGSQTFDDNILKLIGRRHNSAQIYDTVNAAKSVGFKNISVDLIYGLPSQSLEGLKSDIDKFLALDIQHISTYGLKIEEGTPFYDNVPNNLPDDDEQALMYECINDILTKNGFYRYEVSNFAKPKFESKHNLNYWNNEEYYGFGVAAHGYVDGVRYSNYLTTDEYMNNPSVHEHGKFLTDKEKLEEEIFLGFRKTEGINVSKINEKYNIDFDKKYGDVIRKFPEYIEKTPNGYAFNLKGTLLSNEILSEFIEL